MSKCKKKIGKAVVVVSTPDYSRKPKFIYTITCLYDLPPYCLDGKYKTKTAYKKAMKEYRSHGGSRTFGWYPSLRKAREAIETNDGDMHEYSYKYAVIEKTADGVHAGWRQGAKEYWYEWMGKDEDGQFEPREKPEELKMVVGWGIG